jgi:limonene-1,2-epoxide hydrolase
MSAEPVDTVRRFLGAWSRGTVDELLAYFEPDGVYHNIPMEPWVGHEAIRGGIEGFLQIARDVDFEVTNIAVTGSVVFTERVDSFEMEAGHVDMPVVGVFEMADGKIAAWRDYFDMAMFTGQAANAS